MNSTQSTSGRSREARELTRRRFLERAGLATGIGVTTPAWLPCVALAGTPIDGRASERRDVLVHVFLRGGMDGLTTCVPYGDPDLYAARPTLAVAPPGASNGALDLDGFFGLAPAAAPLLTPWNDSALAIVHAAGSTDPTRSHFDAMKAMESGTPGLGHDLLPTGWLGRHLASVSSTAGTGLRALGLEDLLPQNLAGGPQTLPIADPAAFRFPGRPITKLDRARALDRMYQGAPEILSTAAQTSFETIDLLQQVDFAGYVPSGGAGYPTTEFGAKLRSSAALIKAGVGVEAISIDLGGWDLHNQLGPIAGDMAALLDELSRALEAFYIDTYALRDRLTVVVMSEFGRRVAQNGSLGVDHGHGNCMLLMGGAIAGGRVFGQWPGLHPAQLDNGDLAITTDYRDVLSEILERRLGNTDLAAVFPGHTPTFLGVTA